MVVARLREWIEGISIDNDVTTVLRLSSNAMGRIAINADVDNSNEFDGDKWADVISLHTPLSGPASLRRQALPSSPPTFRTSTPLRRPPRLRSSTSLPRPKPFPHTIRPPAPIRPRRVGSYWMHEEIAHGGMASVHLGRSTGSGPPRLVAIKQLDPTRASQPGAMTMFLDEGRLLARIRHPNVVPILDVVVNPLEGEVYLVMEYVHGATLSHLVSWEVRQGKPPPVRIAAGIMVGILRGLHAAHEATNHDGRALGIVHCDVSPQNMMVGSDGVARIIDFGVAKSVLQNGHYADSSEGIAERPRGKRGYLSPEQIRGKSLDRRTDVFSAGIVLWELLAGRRLFQGASRRAVWARILRGQTPPPSSCNPEASRDLDEAVLCALDSDRERRFPTAKAFTERLMETTDVAGQAEIRAWVQRVAVESLLQQSQRAAEIVGGSPTAAVIGERPRVGLRRLTEPRRIRAFGVTGALFLLVLVAMLRFGGHASKPPMPTESVSGAPRPVASDPPSSFVVESLPAQAKTPAPAAPAVPAAPAALRPVPPAPPSSPASSSVDSSDDAPGTNVGGVAATLAEAPLRGGAEAKGSVAPARTARKMTRALRAIEDLNRKALRAYRLQDFSDARRMLYSALSRCRANRLDLHPEAAMAHAQLAAVLVRRFNQHDLAVERFRTALRIDRHVPVAPLLSDPAVSAAFRLAAGGPGGRGGGARVRK